MTDKTLSLLENHGEFIIEGMEKFDADPLVGRCGHYCQRKLKNRTCGRIDFNCFNLKNCTESYKKRYKLEKKKHLEQMI